MFVVTTETGWESASGAVVSAGGVGTADRSSEGGGETAGGVNFAESVALEPCAYVVVVQESVVQTGFLHLCNGKGLPQTSWQRSGVLEGSVVLLGTNLMERPECNTVFSTKGLAHK